VLPLCAKLWSLEHFAAVFALLFHRWLVETEAGCQTKGWVMRFNVFLKGAYQLFWFDVQHETRKLWPLYIRLRDHMFQPSSPFFNERAGMLPPPPPPPQRWEQDLLLRREHLHQQQQQQQNQQQPGKPDAGASATHLKETIRKDFSFVLCRFYYYYSTRPERVGSFCVNQLQLDEGLDTFVPQLVVQLRALRNEGVLVRYLKCTALLPVVSLKISSRNKLHAALNELQLPGAPLHPTIKVMQQAEQCMNTLFPEGRCTRFAINLFFRLLRPLYLPRTILALFEGLFPRKQQPRERRDTREQPPLAEEDQPPQPLRMKSS
jgi:hypothetical protein